LQFSYSDSNYIKLFLISSAKTKQNKSYIIKFSFKNRVISPLQILCFCDIILELVLVIDYSSPTNLNLRKLFTLQACVVTSDTGPIISTFRMKGNKNTKAGPIGLKVREK